MSKIILLQPRCCPVWNDVSSPL